MAVASAALRLAPVNTLSQVLKWLSAGAFVALGAVTFLAWLRNPDRKRGYIAIAVGLLGLVSVAGDVMQVASVKSALQSAPLALRLTTGVELGAIVLSGYALVLLRDAIVPYARWIKRTLELAGAAAVALGFAISLPTDSTVKPTPVQAAVIFFIVGFWTFCLAEPAARLWIRAKHLPSVQRGRMRALSAGYGLIAVILVAAIGAGSAAQSLGFQITTQALVLVSVPILYASFAPPSWLRRAWRAKEEALFARAVQDLLTSWSDPRGMAEAAVEWAARLVGAEGSALIDYDGSILAARAMEPAVVESVRHDPDRAMQDAELIVVPMNFEAGRGRLVVRAGPVTPLFGADEVLQLEVYATHLTLALDRARLSRALRESEARAREASQAKSNFLANMSHDLRTPMSAILGFSDVLAEGVDGALNSEQRQDVERIRSAGMHLLSLLDDVLDISKIEAGKLQLVPQDVDLSDVTSDILATLRPVADNKSLELTSRGLEGVRVFADQQRLRQVLLNLLTNALKFTQKGGVTVACEPAPSGMVRITVQDTGKGIPEDSQERIFDEFEQVESGGDRARKGGTGLGLAICRRLVELHGGRIGCDSVLGAGSTFWFTLKSVEAPVRLPSLASLQVAAVASDGAGNGRAVPWGGSTSGVILVIDDEADARALISKRLQEGGYRSVQAASGAEGIRLARSLVPLAITLDLRMPVTSGADVLQALAGDSRTRDIPVVLVTINEQNHVAVPHNRVLYVRKPFTKEDLLDAINAVVQPLPSYDVVVVDDDPDVPELVGKALASINATLRYASSGPEALETANAKPPDLMFVDLLMPEMSGFEVISRLRANARTRDVPIIVVSAKELTAEDIRLLNSQIDRLVKKTDLAAADLAATVRQLVGTRRVPV